MISPYFYDECCKENMLKLIYLTKCIIDLTVYPSLQIASMESLIKAVLENMACILQANTK